MALDIITFLTSDPNPPNANIFCDSQAALRSITNRPTIRSGQKRIIDIQNKIKLIKTLFSIQISFFWCPGHSDIPENEEIDKLAKSACEDIYNNQEFHVQSISPIITQVKKIYKKNKIFKPIIRNNIKLITQPNKIFKSLSELEKGSSSIIYQL